MDGKPYGSWMSFLLNCSQNETEIRKNLKDAIVTYLKGMLHERPERKIKEHHLKIMVFWLRF